MPRKQDRPAWFVMYILLVFMIAALVLEGRDGLPGWANESLGVGIVLFVFSMMALWVHVNTAALMDEEMERAKYEKLVITEYAPKQPYLKLQNGDGDDDLVSHDPFQANGVLHSRN